MMEEWLIFINDRCRPSCQELKGDDFCKIYEFKLKTARAMAFITSVMYSLNWFLSFSALTWASAVVLGGLLANLSEHDYFSVLALLLLEAVRLATATFFGKFVTWKLVHGSVDPNRLIYNDTLRQKLQGIARIIEQAFQLTVIAISILVPAQCLEDLKTIQDLLNAPLPSSQGQHRFDGLKTSLRIFYVLVLVNGAIAGIAVIFSKNVVPFVVNSFSLRKYYEKVVWKGMDEGLLHATEFELLSWAFEMQADEYRRNTRAPVVKDLYGDMMKYLYYHPRNKGFEAAKVALESNDTFEREAAANIVGLWTLLALEGEAPISNNPEVPNALARLVMQKKLLAKLAKALDNDETGRAASVGFQMLAEKDPEGMLAVRSEGGNENLADILMDRIHEAVRSRKPKKAIIDIKAMIVLLPKLMADGIIADKYCKPEKLRVMKDDMRIIVTEYKTDLKRMQAVAAKAYTLLMIEEERRTTDLREDLKAEPNYRNQHILESEANYVYEVLGLVTEEERVLPTEWGGAVELRAIEQMQRLPLLAWPCTALVATAVNIVILAVASKYIIRYAHF